MLSAAGDPALPGGHADSPAAAARSDAFGIAGAKNPHAAGRAEGTAIVSSVCIINRLKIYRAEV